ncbi:MAG: acireductone dioxygenase [Nostoc sp. TH1S01]|nr:acireductone dioxygenase [Nostoc sp. TH1S01]
MAILKLEDGKILTDINHITQELAPLNIQLNRWPVQENPELHHLLTQDSLNEDQKAQVLEFLDDYFKQLQQTAGYQSRDLIVLHPGIPDLDGFMTKFAQIHTHADDEVRYVIDGEAIFGFVRPDDSQVELTVQPEEYINVPAGTEHWFYLTPAQRVKAIRYFIDTAGWVPQYTGREIRTRQTVASQA